LKLSTSITKNSELKAFLEEKVEQYNEPRFISTDPIAIPHGFRKKEDIEIAGLFAAVLAWGQRGTIIRKCKELMMLMDNDPHLFILHHSESDLKTFEAFKHRTFNAVDTKYFITFLKWYYRNYPSLENAFVIAEEDKTIESGLARFHQLFFNLSDSPYRTRKHVSTPERKSTCKRLNMYLRWMVRQDTKGVDFGIWRNISPSKLICPCDVHVDRVARKLKLIKRKPTDWQTALELTNNLRKLDASDPVKYDFALFGLGIEEGWSKD
jgi:uncharacterized protein (TIGR02757 family)